MTITEKDYDSTLVEDQIIILLNKHLGNNEEAKIDLAEEINRMVHLYTKAYMNFHMNQVKAKFIRFLGKKKWNELGRDISPEDLNHHQLEAYSAIKQTKAKAFCLTGPPNTGKSYVLYCVKNNIDKSWVLSAYNCNNEIRLEDWDKNDWAWYTDPNNQPYELLMASKWPGKPATLEINTWINKILKLGAKTIILDEPETLLNFRNCVNLLLRKASFKGTNRLEIESDHLTKCLEYLKNLKDMLIKKGVSLIISTHHEDVVRLCDDGYHLDKKGSKHNVLPTSQKSNDMEDLVNSLKK